MNKSMFTKLFALVLMVCVVFSLAIVSSSAAGEEGIWTLVTDASTLKAGDEIVITNKTSTYAMSTNQKSSNRGSVAVTTNGNELNVSSTVQILTLQDGTTAGTFALYTGSGYLYAASSSGNQLKTKTTKDVHGSWTITISNGVASIVATGSSNRKVMQYNPNTNNGDPLFACYASASQTALAIYRYEIPTSVCAHTNVEKVAETPATCTETGFTAGAFCKDCEKYIEGHEVTDKLGHTGGKATCKELAICERPGCGVSYGELGAHTFVNSVCSLCGEEEPNEVVLTVNSLGIGNSKYESKTANVDGVAFQFIQIGNYGNGIQVRDKDGNTSSLWNTVAFSSGIKKIVLQFDSAKDTYDNSDAEIFTFGNEMGEAAYTTKLSTVAGTKTYEIIPDKNTYTFCKFEHDISYTFYWASITIVLDKKVEAPKFNDASVILGKDLGMIYNVTSPAGEPTMTVEFADKTVDLVAEKLENGTYNFTFKGIGPHQMAENIKATLKVNGEAVAEFDDYSVEKNLKNIKTADANLTDLVNATLVYGAQAEAYKGIENGVDLTGIEVNNAAIGDDANALEYKNGADCAFTAAGVNFDSANRIYVKFNVTGDFKFSVNGTEVALEKSEDGSYKFYTDALTAKQFNDSFTFVIETAESKAILVYSVNSYAYAMQNDAEMANLVKALYAYGVAAEKYTA